MAKIQIKFPENLDIKLDLILEKLQTLNNEFQPKNPIQFLTRHEVAAKLRVDISTVHNMTVKGILTKYQISGRVLYKLEDIEKAIVEIKK